MCVLLLLAAAALCRGQTTRVDATRLLRPSGTNSRLLVTNSSGSTVWTDAENFLSGATGISISGNTIAMTLGGSAGDIQFNNTNALGGSANLHWDNAGTALRIGQPVSGTGRLTVKGSNTNNTTFSFQGFDSGDVERSRITNSGYFQGTGLGRVGFDYSSAFTLDARLYQPTSVSSTATSGSTALVAFAGGFAPTSGNAQMNLVEVTGTVNQSGGANGKVRMLYLAANAVSAPNLYALETVGGYSLIGDGAIFPEVMPRLAVVGLGNTGATNAFGVYNTNGTPGFFVGDDGQAGIGNAAPAYSLDITGSDAIRLPKGSTVQRPANNQGIFRFNTTDNKFEGYDGSAWVQFGAGGGSGAPTDAPYLTLGSNATLSAERIFVAGANLNVSDGGANSTFTLDALSEKFVTGGIISPAQLSGNQNDWSPTGLSGASIIRLSTDATFRIITGLAGGEAGRRITLMNVGAYTVMLKDESGASTDSNRFSFDSQDWFVLPGRSVELVYDALAARWRTLSPFDYCSDYVLAAQFRHGVAGATGTGTSGDYFVKANSGGSGVGLGGGPWGQSGISTSSSATGRGSIGASSNAMVRSTSSTYLRFAATLSVDVLSDGTNTYNLRCGWMDNSNPLGDPTNGVFFRCTDAVNSGNWQLVCRKSGSETSLNTNVGPVTSGSPAQSLIIAISPNGAAAEGYIDGVSIGVITTNVPNTANMGYYTQIEKTAGTSARTLSLSGANVLVVGNKRQ